MHKRAFDAALRAALKITFSTTLLACGGTVDFDETSPAAPEPEQPDTSASTGASSGTGGAGGEGGEGGARPTPRPRPEPRHPREQCEAELTPPVDWWTFDAHTFACCTQSLDHDLQASGVDAWLAASVADLPTQNCCSQLVSSNGNAFWTGEPLPHPAPEGVMEACCTLQTGTPGCTAWGPPMPPAMAAADLDLWFQLEDVPAFAATPRAA